MRLILKGLLWVVDFYLDSVFHIRVVDLWKIFTYDPDKLDRELGIVPEVVEAPVELKLPENVVAG